MNKIKPFLWFDNQAEEAVNFYTTIFKNSKVGNVSRYMEGGPGPVGQVMVAEFEIEGLPFIALNGGPIYSFTPAISFMINCETQDEVDVLWEGLTEGGKEIQCGWLVDKFGVSWQVVPRILGDLLGDPDTEKSGRVMQAMLQMVKLDISKLEQAYRGEEVTV